MKLTSLFGVGYSVFDIQKRAPALAKIHPHQLHYSVNYNNKRRHAQPVCMPRAADIAMQQKSNGVPQATAGAPVKAH